MDPLERRLAYAPNDLDLDVVRQLPFERLPTISVVIPSRNQGGFLRACLESVFAQEYPRLEVFVADGGSADGSLGVLEEYTLKHPGVFDFVSEPDGGQANGVNKAIDATRGDIIAWINSDDIYLAGAFWKVVAFFHFNRCAIVAYGRNWYTDERLAPKVESPVRWSASLREQRRRMMHFCLVPQPSLFFRRAAVEFGHPRPSIALDYDLWLRWQKDVPFYFIDDYLSYSRLHRATKSLTGGRSLYHEIFRIVHRHYGTVPYNFTEMLAQYDAYGNVWAATGQAAPITRKLQLRALAYWVYFNVRWLPRAIIGCARESAEKIRESLFGRV